MPNMLTDEQMNQLGEMLADEEVREEEQPVEGTDVPEDQVQQDNENVGEMSEGDAAASDEEAERQELTEAAAEDAAQAQQEEENAAQNAAAAGLPEGFESVEQLAAAYDQLRRESEQRGQDMQALRDMTGQLVSIAEALGYGQDVGSVDLNVDEAMKERDPEGYERSRIRREVADQLKPMLEQQQRNLRGRLVDQAWKNFAGQHGDLSDMMDDIKQVLKESPELNDDENGLEVAWHLARSRKYLPEAQMMENEDFVKRAAENPKIRDLVIEKYLNEVQRGGEGAPRSVGQGGTATPTARKQAPRTMEEAHKAALKYFE